MTYKIIVVSTEFPNQHKKSERKKNSMNRKLIEFNRDNGFYYDFEYHV